MFGLILGSFANACIYRWPREESVRRGRSRCPACMSMIAWYDNVPLFSWAMLLGRCRRCRSSISIRYPAIEFISGAAFIAAWMTFGKTFASIPVLPVLPVWDRFFGAGIVPVFAAALFLWALIVVFWIDLDCRIIPNEITIPFIILGIIGSLFFWIGPADPIFDMLLPQSTNWRPEIFALARASVGFVVGAVTVLAIRVFGSTYCKIRGYQDTEAMGMGDVKFLGFVGAWLGTTGALHTLFVGAMIGGGASIILLSLKTVGLQSKIPFGPFLVIGAITTLFRWNLFSWFLLRGSLLP